jgi:hypothetical protein
MMHVACNGALRASLSIVIPARHIGQRPQAGREKAPVHSPLFPFLKYSNVIHDLLVGTQFAFLISLLSLFARSSKEKLWSTFFCTIFCSSGIISQGGLSFKWQNFEKIHFP